MLKSAPGLAAEPLPPDRLPPLHVAAAAGRDTVVLRLLDYDANPDRYADIGAGELAPAAFLSFASDRSRAGERVVTRLAERGANLRLRSSRGRTLLMAAVAAGASARSLRTVGNVPGIDLDARAADGLTALHEAVLARAPDAIEFLLASGADRNLAADGIGTPREVAMAAMQPPRSIPSQTLRELLARRGLSEVAMSAVLAAFDRND